MKTIMVTFFIGFPFDFPCHNVNFNFFVLFYAGVDDMSTFSFFYNFLEE
jgi:hypothetical protein